MREFNAHAVLGGAMTAVLDPVHSQDDIGVVIIPLTVLTRARLHVEGALVPYPGWSTRLFDAAIPNPWLETVAAYHKRKAIETEAEAHA